MYSRQTVVQNPTGLHARPAADLVKLVKELPQEIVLVTERARVNPKSIISILTAGMDRGTAVTVEVTGEDEEAVCNQIVAFIETLREG